MPGWPPPPPWPLYGVPCVRCGLPGMWWAPGIVYHTVSTCTLDRADTPPTPPATEGAA